MKDIIEILSTLSSSNNVFNKYDGTTYKSIFKQAQKLNPPVTQKQWILINQDKNISEFLMMVIFCIKNNINIIISSPLENNYKLKNIPVWNDLTEGEKHTDCNKFFNIKIAILSSGSTGEKKIIVHDLKSILFSAITVANELESNDSTTWLLALPIYHIAGFSLLMRALVTNSPLEKISKTELINNPIEGTISLVSSQLDHILKNNRINNNKIKILVGGGKASPDQLKKMIEKKYDIYTSYGLSEYASTFSIKKQIRISDISSCGAPIKGAMFKVKDNRLAIKGESIFKGTLDINQQINPPVLDEGYYITQDIVEIFDNEIHIKSRADDILISGGVNFSLNEVRDIVNKQFPKINYYLLKQAHKKWGDSYSLIIQTDDDRNKIEHKLRTLLLRHLKPNRICFIPLRHKFHGIKPSKEELDSVINSSTKG